MAMQITRRRKGVVDTFDRNERFELAQAVTLMRGASFARFDESVDLAVRLGVNPTHADQMVRGAVVLPHGIGKVIRVVVFAKGERADQARAAGADEVGSDELIERIKGGWLDFDTAIATPDMMLPLSKIGKILGPRKLMPNPKVGTVTLDVEKAVREAKAGRVQFRVEKAGIVHAPIGKKSFSDEQLVENAQVLLQALLKAKPSTAKGTYMRGIALSSSMGPGVRIDPASIGAEK